MYKKRVMIGELIFSRSPYRLTPHPPIYHWMMCEFNPSEVYILSNGRWGVSRHDVPKKISSPNISYKKFLI